MGISLEALGLFLFRNKIRQQQLINAANGGLRNNKLHNSSLSKIIHGQKTASAREIELLKRGLKKLGFTENDMLKVREIYHSEHL